MSLEAKPVDATAKQAADAKASLLLRKAEDSYAFPVLDSVGNQFARSLRDLVRALGAPTVNVERAPAVQMRFADWCSEVAPGLFWRYHAPPLKGPVLLAATRPLVLQLVDIFYGGKGQIAGEREDLTDAEERFAARLGRDMGMQLAAAWKSGIEPELDAVTSDPAKLAAVRADDDLLVSASLCAAACSRAARSYAPIRRPRCAESRAPIRSPRCATRPRSTRSGPRP